MSRILMNGVDQSSVMACEHWGELLERLDQQCAGSGHVLTAVRFDGVDQPSFRDPTMGPAALGTIALVDAESVAPTQLLSDSLNEAVNAARTLATGAERVGDAFRGFDVSTAQTGLSDLARGTGTLVAIIQAVSQAIGVDLKVVTCAHGSGAAMIDQLVAEADALIEAQEAEDWISVADIIEYDIAPSLRQWPDLFEAIRTAMLDKPSVA